jgi:hypothetical protein
VAGEELRREGGDMPGHSIHGLMVRKSQDIPKRECPAKKGKFAMDRRRWECEE